MLNFDFYTQVTRLLPDAVGTTCGQRLEKVFGCEHAHILRVPFRDEKGMVRKWISRFEVWPYLENYTEVNFNYSGFWGLKWYHSVFVAFFYEILKLNNLFY